MNERDKLKRKATITKLETEWEKYKKMKNKVNKELRDAKRKY